MTSYARFAEIPELGSSLSFSQEFALKGEQEDPHDIAHCLMKFPFTGFFYGSLDEPGVF